MKLYQFAGFIIGGVAVLYFVLILFVLAPSYNIYFEAMRDSCKKIDMDYNYILPYDYCIDKNGVFNYIKMDCIKLGWRNYDCIPHIISFEEANNVLNKRR